MYSSNRNRSSLPMAAMLAAGLALTAVSLPFAMAMKAAAAEPAPLDTSKLPRLSGAKVMFESPQTTILTVSEAVPAAAEAQAKALKGEGWIVYVPPSTAIKKDQTFEMRTFKKGRQGITLMVQSAPAQAGATTVQFTEAPIASDLPVPADAEEVVFDASRPFVTFTTGAPVREAFQAFDAGLKADGWQRWEPAPGQTSPTVEVTDEIARMFYLKAGASNPIYVTVNAKPGPRVAVKAETVPPSLLNPPKPEAKAEGPSPAEEAARKQHSELSDVMDKAMSGIAGNIMKEVEDTLANGGKPKSQPRDDGAAAAGSLKPMKTVETALPVPEGAESLSIGDDEVEFETIAAVRIVGQFFKTEMKKAEWTMRPSVISRDTMEVQTYTRGNKSIDITIMQMGSKARVTARGSGLARADATSADEAGSGEGKAVQADVKFEAEDKQGLPVPTPHSMTGREETLFRVSVTTTVKAPVSSLVAFYREALGKLSWSEDTSKAKISSREATLSFTSPQGPAVLSVTQKGDEATSLLFVRKTKDAEASGLMPKAGKVTLLIGNAAETEGSITAAGKTVKAAPGIGTKDPNGPKFELDPGQHKIEFAFKGGKPEIETMDLKAGEIWGILIAPGGALPMQLY